MCVCPVLTNLPRDFDSSVLELSILTGAKSVTQVPIWRKITKVKKIENITWFEPETAELRKRRGLRFESGCIK